MTDIDAHPMLHCCDCRYLHLLTIAIVPCHIYAVFAFIVIGGFLASLNHTRFDLNVPYGIYSVAFHDEHHVAFNYNFGQYHMLWDRALGTYRAPPPFGDAKKK